MSHYFLRNFKCVLMSRMNLLNKRALTRDLDQFEHPPILIRVFATCVHGQTAQFKSALNTEQIPLFCIQLELKGITHVPQTLSIDLY